MKLTEVENNVLKIYAKDIVEFIGYTQSDSVSDIDFVQKELETMLKSFTKIVNKALAKEEN